MHRLGAAFVEPAAAYCVELVATSNALTSLFEVEDCGSTFSLLLFLLIGAEINRPLTTKVLSMCWNRA